MTHPWDRPVFPGYGDESEDVTYAGVGRVICRWEEVEVQLSRLYSIFVGKPHEATAIHEYGAPRIFNERAMALKEAAERYAVGASHQGLEGQFTTIMESVIGWAGRRNDAAHGVVRLTREIRGLWLNPSTAGKIQYCLVPADCDARRFDQTNTPEYVYTSTALLEAECRLHWLAREIEAFCQPPSQGE